MTYKPGSFFLASINGAAGFAIGLGQALCGDPSRYEHAGIIISETGDVVEAEPGGARIGNLSEYAGHALLVSDAPVQQALATSAASYALMQQQAPTLAAISAPFPEDVLRQRVVDQAKALIGTPYSFLDYLALACLHLHLPSKWVRNRVQSSRHAMCSQLTDLAYQRAGISLYDDGRLPGDVMPADLAAYAEDAR